jgi:hypothetical protein
LFQFQLENEALQAALVANLQPNAEGDADVLAAFAVIPNGAEVAPQAQEPMVPK